jgi:hypothetical protein
MPFIDNGWLFVPRQQDAGASRPAWMDMTLRELWRAIFKRRRPIIMAEQAAQMPCPYPASDSEL